MFLAKDKVTKVIKKIRGEQKKLDKEQKRNSLTLKDLKVSTLAYVAAAAAALRITQELITAYEQQVFAEARLEQALRTQKAFTDQAFSSLKNLAKQLQETTVFSDEQTISAQAMLASFKLNAQQLAIATPLMQDMATMTSRAGGGMASLENAAKLMGLALEGQAGRLRQAGISLTDLQIAMIDASDRSEKFAVLTQVIQQNAGGLAEAVGETAVSGFQKLKNTIGDTKETLGEFLSGGLLPIADGTREILMAANQLEESQGNTAVAIDSSLEALKFFTLEITGIAPIFRTLVGESEEFNDSLKDTGDATFEAASNVESLDAKFKIFGTAIKQETETLKGFKDELKDLNDELKDIQGRFFEGEASTKRSIIDQKILINQMEQQLKGLDEASSRRRKLSKAIDEQKEKLNELRTTQEGFSLQREKASIEIEIEQKSAEPRLKDTEDLRKQLTSQFELIAAKEEEIKNAKDSLESYRTAQKKILDISIEVSKANTDIQNTYNNYIDSLEQNLPTERDLMNQRIEQAEMLAEFWERILRAQRLSSETINASV